MATPPIEKLLEALREDRPVVLFLGQDYLRPGKGTEDPILRAVRIAGVRSPIEISTWRDLINSTLNPELLTWLAERFDRAVPSEATEAIFELGWASVFTSSLDHKIVQHLETRGRIPETVLSKDHYARANRSKARTPVHFLFGLPKEESADMRPPRSGAELKRRVALQTTPLLNRLNETATPLGVVVIDGYIPKSDWLDIDQLLAPISTVPGPQVIWFGRDGEATDSAFVEQMEEDGLLISDPRTLAEVLASSSYSVSEVNGIYSSESGAISLPDQKFLRLPPSIRLRTEAAAAVVDDTWTDRVDLDGPGNIEDSFRRFHGDFGGLRATVEGIGRNFAIERDFERPLFSEVSSLLKRSAEQENFVIVHGQSGVGKSIGLARLVRRLRQDLKVPVLFSWGRVPSAIELDDFCEESERAGAIGTVVVCDCNTAFSRYRDLAIGLKSRGRRTVIVGTSYRIEDETIRRHPRFIEVSENLSKGEAGDLQRLLTAYGNEEVAKQARAGGDVHFLALLYRHLSASRARLAGGVSGEASFAEEALRTRARNVPRQRLQGLMAQKLLAAGATNSTAAIFEDETDETVSASDSAARLIDFVMAAGRLDCPVPVNLLIRAVRQQNEKFEAHQVTYLFQELDLFRWKHGDAEGNTFLIQPRLQLEAELVCRRRMGTFEREISCLLALISAVRSGSVDDDPEIEFLLDLLHKMHRDGPRANAYREGYLRIGEALTELRETNRVLDARLMLQESAFRREALFAADSLAAPVENVFEHDRSRILNQAREVIELALKMIAEGTLRAGKRAKENFAVERASIYGYLAVGMAKQGAPEDQVWAQYLAARTAVTLALSSENNYYPLDIGLWAPADVTKAMDLSPEHKAELRADMLSMLDRGNTDKLPPGAAEKFRTRKLKVANVLGDLELKQIAFEELELINPSIAYYLRARDMCSGIFDRRDSGISSHLKNQAVAACQFLEERLQKIQADARCLLLLLQLKWISVTGERLYQRDRCQIPQERAQQESVLNIVKLLNLASGETARNVYRLLEATLEWVRGDIGRSRELFRDLSKDSEYQDSSRVVRRLLLGNGTKGFNGRVQRSRSEGHWSLDVQGFSAPVDALTRDFQGDDLRPGRELRGFNIAFNYLGPIADPIVRTGGRA